MDFITKMRKKAMKNIQRIVLPEGNEYRNLTAASVVYAENIAEIILIGNEFLIHQKAKELGLDINGIEIQDPQKSKSTMLYANYMN